MGFSSYTKTTVEEIFNQFKVIPGLGLSQHKVNERLKKYGLNDIRVREVVWWQILLRQFKSPFIYLLITASILSFLLQENINGLMILLFVAINTTLGFYQEYRSQQALKILQRHIVSKAKVLREGKEEIIKSKELVPGDIVIVEPGDIIQADIRFFDVENLAVDESVLTGESAPVKKLDRELGEKTNQVYKAQNIGFSATTVVSGKGKGIVFATGKNRVVGEIARLTVETVRISSFEKGILKFSKFILRLILFTLILVFLANLILKKDRANVSELIIFSIALAVSVIPEALPVVTTFSLSKGALRLAKNKVVVKRLSAVEDLGSIEILCSDKTGTLTENHLTVSQIYSKAPQNTLFYAALTGSFLHNVKKESSNAFDIALWDRLSKEEKERLSRYKKIKQIPFDPQRRRSSVLIKEGNYYKLIVRGAAEEIVKLCQNIGDQEALNRWLVDQGQQGKRVIAIAESRPLPEKESALSEEEKDLTFLGLISFIDPLKKSAYEAVRKAGKLGIRLKILTGDSKEVAGAVAYNVGLIKSFTDVITGEEVMQLPVDKQHEAVENYSVFARVTPSQKHRIISLLEQKHEVGFLGEGINDAPALKVANVALVVQDAADIAKDAADIILLKKSLKVIIDGIEEGREVFANTIKYIKATLVSNFGNFFAVASASLMIEYLPMLPLQILLLNLLSDFPMIAVATDNIDVEELQKPESYNVSEIAKIAILLGLISTIFDFIFFGIYYRGGAVRLQTNWFIGSILTELVLLFSIRTKFFFFKAKKPSLILFCLSALAAVLTVGLPFTHFGQMTFKFVTPVKADIILIFFIVFLYFVSTEVTKLFYYRFLERNALT